MQKLLLFGLILLTIVIQAQKLPKDALDKNTVLIFSPQASVDKNEETLEFFKEKIIENGFNLVGKHMHTKSQVSLKEIQFDINNKDVKYIFLLTYHHFKGADYDLYFFENNFEDNPDILEPKREILKLKPGFVTTSSDARGTIINKLIKEVEKLKSKYDGIDSSVYDTELVKSTKLTEENTNYIVDLNNNNTIIDRVAFYEENNSIPQDLKSGKLAIINVSKREYKGNKLLNLYIKSGIKKYPYEYTTFKNIEAYKAAGGDNTFDYKLQLTKGRASFISSLKPKYTGTETYKRDMGNKNVIPSSSSGGSNYEKDLFTVILKDNKTNERYVVSKRDFVGRAIKDFIGQLK